MNILKPRKDQKVLLATPHGHEVSARWVKSLLALIAHDIRNHGRIVDGGNYLLNSSGANVTNARNEIVRTFLDVTDHDWLWFVDTDMTFDPDILDRLIESAHPTERPVMGALCFSLQDGWRACPTTYLIRDDGNIGRTMTYEGRMRCLTGSGCLLIHRSVLEGMRDKYPAPYEWFQETRVGDKPAGEDLTFCIRAEAAGYPVHVDTTIKCGHEKPFIVDEAMYIAQREANVREQADPIHPTYAVIASKDRPEMLATLVAQLKPQCTDVLIFDNGYENPPLDSIDAHGQALHRMWNTGIDWAEQLATIQVETTKLGDPEPSHIPGPIRDHNVLIINDDVEVAPDLVARLEAALRSGDYDMAIPGDGTMTGWCFMLRGEAGLRLDEQFEWWYGDTDLAKRCEGRIVATADAHATHLDPMRSTLTDPERLEQARRDEKRYAEKWGIDPSTLWLARHEATL